MPVSAATRSHHHYNKTSTTRPLAAQKFGPIVDRQQGLNGTGTDKSKPVPQRPPTTTRPGRSIHERIESLQARSFGPSDRAQAAVENERNGIDRETVRQLMQLARSGDLKAGLALFKASNASTDLVYRGTRLSELLRSRPDSQDRADWLAALAGGTRSRRAPNSAARQAAEPSRETTRPNVQAGVPKALQRVASTATGGAVVAVASRERRPAPDAVAVSGPSRGAAPPRIAPTPPAKPPHPVGQTERIRTLRLLLANDMSVYISKGKMAKAWQLWVGLGQPLWIGNFPLVQVLHRLYQDVGFTTTRHPRDFLGFVAAVEQRQQALGGLPPADAPCGKAVAWLGAPARLQELSLLESAP